MLTIERQEILMPPPVWCQFRMEGQRHAVALLERDRLAGMTRQLLNVGRPLGHLRGADEYRWAGATDGGRFDDRLEAAIRSDWRSNLEELAAMKLADVRLRDVEDDPHP